MKKSVLDKIPIEDRIAVRKFLYETLCSKIQGELARCIDVDSLEVSEQTYSVWQKTHSEEDFYDKLHMHGFHFNPGITKDIYRLITIMCPKDRTFDAPTRAHGTITGQYNVEGEDRLMQETKNLYVANVDRNMKENEFRDVFSLFGPIISCKLMGDPVNPRRNRGYGFVEYRDKECALAALEAMHQSKMPGRKQAVRVKWSLPSNAHRLKKRGPDHIIPLSMTNVYVANLPPSVQDDQQLEEMARRFGEIKRSYKCKAKLLKSTQGGGGGSLGSGMVRFASPDISQKAVKMINNMEDDIDGYQLSARFAIAQHGEPTREPSPESLYLYKGYPGYDELCAKVEALRQGKRWTRQPKSQQGPTGYGPSRGGGGGRR